MIAFIILYNIFNFPATMRMVQSYCIRNPDSILIYVITSLMLVVNAAIGSIVVYFPLKALAHILRILMEMEFRSRKAT